MWVIVGFVFYNGCLVNFLLGGGLASAAALSTNMHAVTFNSAGLHPATVSELGDMDRANDLIAALRVEGEILTATQENLLVDGLALTTTPIKWTINGVKAATGHNSDFSTARAWDAVGKTYTLNAIDTDGEALKWSQYWPPQKLELHSMAAVQRSLNRY